MNIYQYLKRDHRKVADLMEQVLHSKSVLERDSLFGEIQQELTLHAATEEATFYKAIEEASRNKKVEENMHHAEHEHDQIRHYLDDLCHIHPESREWMETFKMLHEVVTHHVQEEETKIFDKARQCLSESDSINLARKMDRMKKEKLDSQAA